MKTIYIYCEGPTEESFINAVLYPYFLGMGIYVCPIVCETRRDANRKYRGGVSRYAYGLNTTTGSFDDAIKVSQRGHYYLAVRNNSSKPVHVYGHVNY